MVRIRIYIYIYMYIYTYIYVYIYIYIYIYSGEASYKWLVVPRGLVASAVGVRRPLSRRVRGHAPPKNFEI